jgi:hypothetical protein
MPFPTPTKNNVTQPGSPLIPAERVENKYGDVINLVLPSSDAADAARYSTWWNVPNAMEIIRVLVSFTTASTSGTLQLEKLTGTQAPGSGATILDTTISLAGAANTEITRNQKQMTTARAFDQGDRLAIIDGGNLANLTQLVITIYYKPLGRGGYR